MVKMIRTASVVDLRDLPRYLLLSRAKRSINNNHIHGQIILKLLLIEITWKHGTAGRTECVLVLNRMIIFNFNSGISHVAQQRENKVLTLYLQRSD